MHRQDIVGVHQIFQPGMCLAHTALYQDITLSHQNDASFHCFWVTLFRNIRNITKLNEQELKFGVFSAEKSWHSQYKDSAYIFIGRYTFKLLKSINVYIYIYIYLYIYI